MDSNLRTLGKYRLLSSLGKGGMGEVFRAHDDAGRVVAVKTIRGDRSADVLAQRFDREVELATKMRDPHVVSVLEYGESDGTVFMVMEYVDGGNLRDFQRLWDPVPVDWAVSLVLQAARGLRHAHSLGIVHRDIKPANLLLDRNWHLKLADLGLARCLLSRGATLTQPEDILGTIDYMSRDQLFDPVNASPQFDIYSLACTLHELLTGKTVLDRVAESEGMSSSDATVTVKWCLLNEGFAAPNIGELRELPAGFEDVFQRMIAESTDDGFRSMDEVIYALLPFAGTLPTYDPWRGMDGTGTGVPDEDPTAPFGS